MALLQDEMIREIQGVADAYSKRERRRLGMDTVEHRASEMLGDLIGTRYSDTTLRVATDWLKQERRLASTGSVRMSLNQHDTRKALIDEIIRMYHTTRLSGVPASDHILSKPSVQKAFDALATPSASRTE